jgi:hypothetical protein
MRTTTLRRKEEAMTRPPDRMSRWLGACLCASLVLLWACAKDGGRETWEIIAAPPGGDAAADAGGPEAPACPEPTTCPSPEPASCEEVATPPPLEPCAECAVCPSCPEVVQPVAPDEDAQDEPPPICWPDCEAKTCGEDGCGGICGLCGDDEVCHQHGCCAPSCEERVCGYDGCGGTCGDCSEGTVCKDGVCQCDQVCGAKECGASGCYERNCGHCPSEQVCRSGQCVDVTCSHRMECWSEELLPPGLTRACVKPHFDEPGVCAFRLEEGSEVLTNLQGIYNGAAVYYGRAEPYHYSHGKTRLTGMNDPAPLPCSLPASQGITPLELTCCSSLGGPDDDWDDRCDADPWIWSTSTWSDLGFRILASHAYVYDFDKGWGDEAFTARAMGDHDCDTMQTTFSLIAARGEEPCTLAAPTEIHYWLPDGYGEGSVTRTGTIPIPEEQLFGFASHGSVHLGSSPNPFFSEVELSLARLVHGLHDHFEASPAGACRWFDGPDSPYAPSLDVRPWELTCCATMGGPDEDQDLACDADPDLWLTSPEWSSIGFALYGEHRFVYGVTTSDDGLARAIAYGDADCDNIQSTFVRFVRATESQTGCEAEIIDGYFIKNESE